MFIILVHYRHQFYNCKLHLNINAFKLNLNRIRPDFILQCLDLMTSHYGQSQFDLILIEWNGLSQMVAVMHQPFETPAPTGPRIAGT